MSDIKERLRNPNFVFEDADVLDDAIDYIEQLERRVAELEAKEKSQLKASADALETMMQTCATQVQEEQVKCEKLLRLVIELESQQELIAKEAIERAEKACSLMWPDNGHNQLYWDLGRIRSLSHADIVKAVKEAKP